MINSPRTTLSGCFPGALAVTIIIAMIWQSSSVFAAAVTGLRLWWDIVVPALLPFFIAAEVLVGLGVVHGMGVLMEPLMRPLFNIPGTGSFVLAMGLASGYPIGSVLTSRLRKEQLCTKVEGERLMSFANTADPLFMSGAVAVGMFRLPAVAGLIMAAHYSSTLVLGLLLRFYKKDERDFHGITFSAPSLSSAVNTLIRARRADGRPIGRLLGDAVNNSMKTLLLIGGFIILFSVITNLLTTINIVSLTAILLRPLGIQPQLAGAVTSGLFEITLGVQQASSASVSLASRLVVASAIIAWSGLSVHAQVAAIIQGTDLSIAPYIIARAIHCVLAAAATILWLRLPGVIPVTTIIPPPPGWFQILSGSGTWLIIILTTWLVSAMVTWMTVSLIRR